MSLLNKIKHSIVYFMQALYAAKKNNFFILVESVIYFPVWLKYYYFFSDPLKNQIPWINFLTIRFLSKIVQKEFKVFEFGSGGSTFFFSKRCSRVFSVEHNEMWFEGVMSAISKNNIKNSEIKLFLPEANKENSKLDFSDPSHFYSSDESYSDKTFKEYSNYILSFPDNYFDIIIVDGRARPSCIKSSLNKVKNLGYIILDNSEREYYLSAFNKFNLNGNYKLIYEHLGPGPYTSVFWKTSIWQRIK